MRARWEWAPRFAWCLASSVTVLVLGRLAGLRLNLTGSLPVGLYVAAGAAPVRGALVLVCLPPEVAAFARARGYVPNGGPLALDRKGRALPGLANGRYVVGPGELWLLSSYSPWSFDSRYFGAVKVGQVRA